MNNNTSPNPAANHSVDGPETSRGMVGLMTTLGVLTLLAYGALFMTTMSRLMATEATLTLIGVLGVITSAAISAILAGQLKRSGRGIREAVLPTLIWVMLGVLCSMVRSLDSYLFVGVGSGSDMALGMIMFFCYLAAGACLFYVGHALGGPRSRKPGAAEPEPVDEHPEMTRAALAEAKA